MDLNALHRSIGPFSSFEAMRTWWHDFVKAFKAFGRETTIHGIFYLVSYKLHLLERIFWFIVITLTIGGTVSVSLSNWRRYAANPTVVSIEKDFRNWHNLFPAATGCLENKVDENQADEYIEETWGVNDTTSKYDYYMSFITAVANISFKTLDGFEQFKNDSTLRNVDMMRLAAKVHPEVQGTLVTFDTEAKSTWNMIITENGICFTVNSLFSNYFSYSSPDKQVIQERPKLLSCHYLNGLCYARYDSDFDSPVNFHIHSYLDIVHATSESPWFVGSSQEVELNYRMEETSSDESLKSLSPVQRRCRFEDEPISDDISVYSTSICYMVCRYKKVMELCGCRPYFYHNFGGEVCNVSGLLCVAKLGKIITEPPSTLGCKCPQPCNMIRYSPQIPKVTVWEYGYFDQRITFRWGLLPPTTKYRRNILFSFDDLIVSFGGTASLFLGISFISIVEVIYHLFKYIFKF